MTRRSPTRQALPRTENFQAWAKDWGPGNVDKFNKEPQGRKPSPSTSRDGHRGRPPAGRHPRHAGLHDQRPQSRGRRSRPKHLPRRSSTRRKIAQGGEAGKKRPRVLRFPSSRAAKCSASWANKERKIDIRKGLPFKVRRDRGPVPTIGPESFSDLFPVAPVSAFKDQQAEKWTRALRALEKKESPRKIKKVVFSRNVPWFPFPPRKEPPSPGPAGSWPGQGSVGKQGPGRISFGKLPPGA